MSVELMEVRIKTQLSYVIFVVVYHPPPNKSNGYTIDHIITHVLLPLLTLKWNQSTPCQITFYQSPLPLQRHSKMYKHEMFQRFLCWLFASDFISRCTQTLENVDYHPNLTHSIIFFMIHMIIMLLCGNDWFLTLLITDSIFEESKDESWESLEKIWTGNACQIYRELQTNVQKVKAAKKSYYAGLVENCWSSEKALHWTSWTYKNSYITRS